MHLAAADENRRGAIDGQTLAQRHISRDFTAHCVASPVDVPAPHLQPGGYGRRSQSRLRSGQVRRKNSIMEWPKEILQPRGLGSPGHLAGPRLQIACQGRIARRAQRKVLEDDGQLPAEAPRQNQHLPSEGSAGRALKARKHDYLDGGTRRTKARIDIRNVQRYLSAGPKTLEQFSPIGRTLEDPRFKQAAAQEGDSQQHNSVLWDCVVVTVPGGRKPGFNY